MSRTQPDIITIGRDDESCDIVMGDAPGVSSVHCAIRFDATRNNYVVQDLGSTNGTSLILGAELHPVPPGVAVAIGPGSLLRLGTTWVLEPDDALLVKLQRPGQPNPQIFLVDGGPITVDGLALRRLVPCSQVAAHPDSPAGMQASTSVPITLGRRMRVGRNPDADIVLDAPMISGYHVEIEFPPDDNSALVTDLQSSNGLFVNCRDNRVNSARVGPGDVLFLGSYRLPVAPLLEQFERGSNATSGFHLPTDGLAVPGPQGNGADLAFDTPKVGKPVASSPLSSTRTSESTTAPPRILSMQRKLAVALALGTFALLGTLAAGAYLLLQGSAPPSLMPRPPENARRGVSTPLATTEVPARAFPIPAAPRPQSQGNARPAAPRPTTAEVAPPANAGSPAKAVQTPRLAPKPQAPRAAPPVSSAPQNRGGPVTRDNAPAKSSPTGMGAPGKAGAKP